jgi:hypothetical protein
MFRRLYGIGLSSDKEIKMIDAVDVFFDTDEFASSAVYVDTAGETHDITVIFNEPFHVQAVGGIEYQSKDPSVLCKSVDVIDADSSAEIIYKTVTYHVIEVQPDGTGITILILSLD